MTVLEAISKRRSIRKFQEDKPVEKKQLLAMVEAARLAPQAANIQPVRYAVVSDSELVKKIFSVTKWAGYLKDYAPKEGERPTGFIIVMVQENLKGAYTGADVGAAVENMLLAAVEMNLGCCWIGSVDRDVVKEVMNIPDGLEIHSVVAVGVPGEDPVFENKMDDSIRYYLDEEKRLHVPKRTMEEVLIK